MWDISQRIEHLPGTEIRLVGVCKPLRSVSMFPEYMLPIHQCTNHREENKSIVGYALLKPCPEFVKHMPFLGRNFGPRERCIVQTTATAAGGMSNVFTSAFPARYQFGLLPSPAEDFWGLVTLTAVGGYFGLFFAAPRKSNVIA